MVVSFEKKLFLILKMTFNLDVVVSLTLYRYRVVETALSLYIISF